MFIAKAVVVASVVASATTDLLDAMIAASPVLVMILDYIYKKRLNEIFSRWKYLKEAVIPRIEAISQIASINGRETPSAYFECDIMERRSDIQDEERNSKSNFLLILLLFSTWGFTAFMKTDLGLFLRSELTIGIVGYCVVMLVIYVTYFGRKTNFKDTYHQRRLALALIASALMSVLYVWRFIGPDLINSTF